MALAIADHPLTPAQQALALTCLPLTFKLIGYWARRFPRFRDEIESAGFLGLTLAATRFDAERGLRFTTYATPLVRGYILTELRLLARYSDHYQAGWTEEAPSREEEHHSDAPDSQELLGLTKNGGELCLHYLAGKTMEQVARCLGISREAATERVRAARLEVREKLGVAGVVSLR